MSILDDQALAPALEKLTGTWRRFGEIGPVYQILHVDPTPSSGNPVARVRVVETGEEFDYRLDRLLSDPPET